MDTKTYFKATIAFKAMISPESRQKVQQNREPRIRPEDTETWYVM